MNPDRVEWPDTISIDEVVERYAYPHEEEYLAALARRFPGVEGGHTPAWALSDGILRLIDGLVAAGYGDPNGPSEWWTEELGLALGAINHGDELVAAWRAFAELPEEEIERIIAAANGPGAGSWLSIP